MLRCLTFIVLLAATDSARAENWPAWRGPAGDGQCAETDLPLTWSDRENVRWKTPLPEPGASTPIVWGDRIFATGPQDEGRRRTVMCFARADGQVLWTREIPFDGQEPTHATNPYCSASPVTDGERVVAWHGSAGMVAYDFEGQELWRRDLGPFLHIWGNASSPILLGDHVIALLGPGPRSMLVALDKRTGADVWQRPLPAASGKDQDEWKGSWSTPIVRTTDAGPELVLSLPGEVLGVSAATGEDRWKCLGLTDLVYTSPLVSPETIVAMSGFGGAALALSTGGSGDVTATHRLWRVEKNPQRIGSGVILGEHIYLLHEEGIAVCLKLATGETVWEERLGGRSWSSLVHAGGRLYALNMDGTTYVLPAQPTYELLATNALGEKTLASPAPSDGQIFLRTFQHLWCIDDGGE